MWHAQVYLIGLNNSYRETENLSATQTELERKAYLFIFRIYAFNVRGSFNFTYRINVLLASLFERVL